MKINFQTLMNNDIIELDKLTEVFVEGKSVWKGLSNNLTKLDEKYTFVKFNNTKTNTFNEAFYKIEVKPKNKIIIEEKKTFEDEMEYGLPEDQKYPLYDKSHVLSAIKFFNYCKDPEKQSILAKAILDKMNKYGISYDSVGKENELRKYLPVENKIQEIKEDTNVEVLNNLRKDIQGEFDAIVDYDARAQVAREAGYTELADTMEDIRDEEKVHVGELQYQLKKIDPKYEQGLIDGEKEAKEESSEMDELKVAENSNIEKDIDEKKPPLDVSVIPNCMGINLCSVKDEKWERQPDGQLTKIELNFNPEKKLTENKDDDDDNIPKGVQMHDDGDGKGRYFYSDSHQKIYPDSHELDESSLSMYEQKKLTKKLLTEIMTIKTGKDKGTEIKTIDNKSIGMKDDFEGKMLKHGDKNVVVEPSNRKIHEVGPGTSKSTKGRLIDFTPEMSANGFHYKGKQVTPYMEKVYKMQKKQADEARKYLKDHKNDPKPKIKSDNWDKIDIIPKFLKKKENE